MTVTLSHNQEEAIRAAIRTGQVASVDELIDGAITGLSAKDAGVQDRTAAERGAGLFNSGADTALLDEAVAAAYAERRRNSPPVAVTEACERLRSFGRRHGLSPGGITLRELRDEARC